MMSYRRRTLQCVLILAAVVMLQVGVFRLQQPLVLVVNDWSEDSYATTTTTSTSSTNHDHTMGQQEHQQQQQQQQQQDLSAQVLTPMQAPQSFIPAARLNECLVEANRIHIHDETKERRRQGLPLFASIVQSPVRMDERRRQRQQGSDNDSNHGNEDQDQEHQDDLYWTAHFTLVHLTWKRKHYEDRVRFPQWSYQEHGAIWYCDGQQAMVVNNGCPKGNSLNIRCPQKNDAVVTNITIYNYTYYVKDHVNCELYHAVKKPHPTARVAAAVMVFNMNVHMALEWMEYHRMIGVDHFYIYVLDDTNDFNEKGGGASSYWPDLDYITYIPWNLNPQTGRSMVDLFLFQTAAQINAILRGRAISTLQWIAMNDMDEYIVTRGNYTATSAIPVAAVAPPLKTFLADYYDDNRNNTNNHNNNVVAAIQGETVSFGKENGSNKTRLPLLLDYTWRNDITYKAKRTKCIVRPTLVEYYVIHWVSWPEPDNKNNKDSSKLVIQKANAEQELWIHHYKTPHNGPFTTDLKGAKTVSDPFLHDMYASIVSERVHDILSTIVQDSTRT